MDNSIQEKKGSTKWVIRWIVIFILLSLVGTFFWRYNNFVALEEWVKTAWSQVENQYQRRSDLIPNIVNTVQWEANFEKSTLTDVISARASATKTNINVNDAAEMAEFQKQQTGISQALSRLLVVTENYPTLQSNKWFADLRVSLEWTENRISTERMRYNEKVQEFNTTIRQFPNNIISSIFWFEQKGLFEAEAGTEKAPEVKFE